MREREGNGFGLARIELKSTHLAEGFSLRDRDDAQPVRPLAKLIGYRCRGQNLAEQARQEREVADLFEADQHRGVRDDEGDERVLRFGRRAGRGWALCLQFLLHLLQGV